MALVVVKFHHITHFSNMSNKNWPMVLVLFDGLLVVLAISLSYKEPRLNEALAG